MELGRFSILLGLGCLWSAGLALADVERLAISQVDPRMPVLSAYVDVTDANENLVVGLLPSDFSAALAGQPLPVTGVRSFDASRGGVAYIFLVDISKSIKQAHFIQMRDAILAWADRLRPGDMAAICSFGEDYKRITDFTADRVRLRAALADLQPTDASTHLHQAIVRALDFQQRWDVPARRVVVLLSDGKDEGSGMTPEDVVTRIHKTQLPIYAIGFSRLPKAERSAYLETLHRFANASGGIYREAGTEPLEDTYAAMQGAIRRVLVLNLACDGCRADGQTRVLELKLTKGRVLTDNLSIRVEDFRPHVPWWRKIPWWAYVLAAAALITFIVILLVRTQQREDIEEGVSAVRHGILNLPSTAVGTRTSAQGPAMRLRLTVVKGPDSGRVHDVRLVNTALIGRNQECDVVIPEDQKVSGRHCELALSKNKVVIYDLGSTNNTIVNGVRIHGRHRLENRDSIIVGQTEMRVVMEEVR